jgi:hypothetical protein
MTTNLLRNHWQRLGAASAAFVGVLFLIVGWWGVSGADLTTEQIPYLASGAVGGLFLLGIAATLWLSADLRDEYLKLDDIYQVVEHLENGSRRGAKALANGAESEVSLVGGSTSDNDVEPKPRPRTRALRAGTR